MDITSILADALEPLTARLTEHQRAAESKAGRKTAAVFHQAERCLRQAENGEQWIQGLTDAAAEFAPRVAFFAVEGTRIRCRAVRGIGDEQAAGLLGAAIACDSAPAIAHAAESNDNVMAIRTAGEVSPQVAGAFQSGGIARICLVPLPGSKRALAVLYAEDSAGKVDAQALELLMSIAAFTRAPAAARPDGLLAIAPAAPPASNPAARRFAMVKVAELRLRHSGKVLAGRARQNIHELLHDEIEAIRAEYRRSFADTSAVKVDYVHEELVRALANDNPELLGSTYTGPLV